MRKFYFFAIIFLGVKPVTIAQVYTWNGAESTDYQVAANWSPVRIIPAISDTLSFETVSPLSITNVANQIIGAIEIAGGTSAVTFSTNLPTNILTVANTVPLIYTSAGQILVGDFLTVQLGAASSFTMASGVFGIVEGRGGKIRINGSLTLAGGALNIDVAGTGGAIINGPSGRITYNSGTFLCTRPASITWAVNSRYFHAVNGAAPSSIPAATWQAGSFCAVTGMNAGNIAPTGLTGINFSNFTWNCPSQNGNINLLPSGAVMNVNGALAIEATGAATSELRLSAAKATVQAGSYLQTGGIVTLQAGGDSTILGVAGNFSHSGGTLNGVSGSLAGKAILDFKGNVSRGPNATWRSDGSNAGSAIIYRFSGTAVQTVEVLSGTWSAPNAGRCNIENNNTDIINGINLTGILRVYNTNGIEPAYLAMNGVIAGSGGVTYTGAGSGGTALIYNSSFFQMASAIEFPVINGPLNLTVNNSLGVSFPADFNRTIAGKLSLLTGNLAIGSGNTLSLTNTTLSNQLGYSSGFITTGTLGRYFPHPVCLSQRGQMHFSPLALVLITGL